MSTARLALPSLLVMLVSIAGTGCDLSTTPPPQIGVDSAAGDILAAPVPWYSSLPYAAQSATWSPDGATLLLAGGIVAAGGQGTAVYSVAVPSREVTKPLIVFGLTHAISCTEQTTDCLVALPDGRIIRLGAQGDTTTLSKGLTSDFLASANGRFILHYEEQGTTGRLVLADLATQARTVVQNYPLSYVCAVAPDGAEVDICGASSVIRADVATGAETFLAPPAHAGWTTNGVRSVQWGAGGMTVLVSWDSVHVRQRYYEFSPASGAEVLVGEVPFSFYTQIAWAATQHRIVAALPTACIYVNAATQCILVQYDFALLDGGTTTTVGRTPAAAVVSLTISPTGKFAAYGVFGLGANTMYLKALP